MDALVVFLFLAALAGLYWVIALIAPNRRDGVPGINLPEVSATPETWRAAHTAISPMMTALAVYATLIAVAMPTAMLAGVDVAGWWFVAAVVSGVIWFGR